MVIVTGKPGTGKSAIVQHIALKYRKKGWTVKPVKRVEEIVNAISIVKGYKDKLFFVFNDPLGKQSIDIILYHSWKNGLETLASRFKSVGRVKLIMSCQTSIFSDNKAKGIFGDKSNVIDIKSHECNLSNEEKHQIFNKYTCDSFDVNLSKIFDEVVKIEEYFPLLCKLYTSNDSYQKRGRIFFEEPVKVIEEEIERYNKTNKQAYCGLFLLVVFNNDFCVKNLAKNDIFKTKFERALKLCGLKKKTTPDMIENSLKSLLGFFVKKIDTTYQFYHDFVMNITTVVFGNIFPNDIIKYADTGLIRRRIRLHNRNKDNDPFAIYINDKHIDNLGQRFFSETFGEHLLDVVLNPCLRNEKVMEAFLKNLNDNPENLHLLLENKTVQTKTQQLRCTFTSRNCHLSKLSFVEIENVSPLFALIAFCHTDLARYCLEFLQKLQIDNTSYSLFSAVCSNGSIDLFKSYFRDFAGEFLTKKWGNLYPIHIVSLFHNVDILKELIEFGADMNLKTDDDDKWTPLMLAAGNDNGGINENDELSKDRRDETVQFLLNNGADINLCNKNGYSPLYLACFDGHHSTVEILLKNRANINSCSKNKTSPLYIACLNGHEYTAELLLSNGSDINSNTKDGTSPLIAACFQGHDNIVHLLLKRGANVNSCDKDGVGPFFIACQNGHESTVQLLLKNEAEINSCTKTGASPLLIASQKGHYSTVELLLNNRADFNLCKKNGTGPLLIACQNGHKHIAELLLNNGVDIDLCRKDGTSPLFKACQKGHYDTVKLLLTNGANVNLCFDNENNRFLQNKETCKNLKQKGGLSPLYVAFFERHNKIVQLLQNSHADDSLIYGCGGGCPDVEWNDKDNCTIQFLLRKDNIMNNINEPDSFFSLFVFHQIERGLRVLEY